MVRGLCALAFCAICIVLRPQLGRSLPQWNCAISDPGSYSRNQSCAVSLLVGYELFLVGKETLTLLTVGASGYHFFIVNGGVLTLKYFQLHGATSSSILGFIGHDRHVFIRSCVFSDNLVRSVGTGSNGGAIRLLGGSGSGVVEISNTTFDGNKALDFGGAIFAQSSSVRVIVNSSYFYANQAGFGGAIHVRENAQVALWNTHISTCVGHQHGGAIYLEENAILAMTGGSMAYNKGWRGGACTCHHASCTFIDTIVGPGNRAIGNTVNNQPPSGAHGGGLHATDNARIVMANVSIMHNSASQGGGLYISESAHINIDRSLVAWNQANVSEESKGGGLFCGDGAVCEIANNTIFAHNQAIKDAGMSCFGQAVSAGTIGCWTDGTARITNDAETCSAGTSAIMTSENWMSQPATCPVCSAETFSFGGPVACTACPEGHYTRQPFRRIAHYHDNANDCRLPPFISGILGNSSTRGHTLLHITGGHFGDEMSTIVIISNGITWTNATSINATMITAQSPPGIGTRNPVTILVDGIASENQGNLRYMPPRILNATSPPFNGGILTLHGSNFGFDQMDQSNVSVRVEDVGSCVQSCNVMAVSSSGVVECYYSANVARGACRVVTVYVGGLASDPFRFCYDVDKGQISGLPLSSLKVKETKNVTYSFELTLAPLGNNDVKVYVQPRSSMLGFLCHASPTTVTFTNESAFAARDVIISTTGNHIDEGDDAVVYTCTVRHVVFSQDAQYAQSPDQTVTIDILNDDNADVHLWTVDPEYGSYDYAVKFLGPVYVQEGGAFYYGIRLDTQPRVPVYIEPQIRVKHLNNRSLASMPPLVAQPLVLAFNATNWDCIQRMGLVLAQDAIDNDAVRFEVNHHITTSDPVFFAATKGQSLRAVIDAIDDDTAGIALASNAVLTLTAGGEPGKIIVARFLSAPVYDVNVFVIVPPSIVLMDMPQPMLVQKTEWENIDQTITVRAQVGAKSGTFQLILVPQSKDVAYNSSAARFTISVVVQRAQDIPPAPLRPRILRGATLGSVNASWSAENNNAVFEVQWSQHGESFEAGKLNSTLTNETHIVIDAHVPLALQVLFVRVREWPNGRWSPISLKWVVASTCDLVSQYLRTAGNMGHWSCVTCPEGASCVGADVTWDKVKPLFGWWRNAIWTEDRQSQFSKCLFPAACLGGINNFFRGDYVDADLRDPAMTDLNESCNLRSGYALECNRHESKRCRLCATCSDGFHRRLVGATDRCDKCPSVLGNKLLITLGALAIFMLMGAMIFMQLKKGGKRSVTSMIKMIVITYIQLCYMISRMNVPWPNVLMSFFSVSSVVSTMGEHLVQLECALDGMSAAEVIYLKQVGYAAFVPALWIASTVSWFTVAGCSRKQFHDRGHEGKRTTRLDGNVATIVYITYLLYPSLCRQAFVLWSCRKVNSKFYLAADLQEICFEGRHLLYILCCSLPQICLYVLGIPLLGLRKIYKRKRQGSLGTSITMYRYGILYSAYSLQRWYWGAIVILRKAFIALITNAITEASVEVHLMVGFLAVAMIMNVWGDPYAGAPGILESQSKMLHRFDLTTLFVLLLTAWSGTFFVLEADCAHDVRCSLLLALVFLMHCFYCIYALRLFHVLSPKVPAGPNTCCTRCCNRFCKKHPEGPRLLTEITVLTNPNPMLAEDAQASSTEDVQASGTRTISDHTLSRNSWGVSA